MPESEIFRCKFYQTFNKQNISVINFPREWKTRGWGEKVGVIYFPTLQSQYNLNNKPENDEIAENTMPISFVHVDIGILNKIFKKQI